MTVAAAFRLLAQRLRHHPRLKRMGGIWRLLRRPYLLALRVLAGGRGLQVEIAGQSLRLHPDLATQGWESIEPEAYAAFVARVRPGDVIFDVGAHVGTYSILGALRAGPAGRVVAYEPFEFTRRYLLQHLDWNGVRSRVHVRTVCCGAQEGTATFYVGQGAEGMNSLVPTAGFSPRPVDVVTLDAEVRSLGLSPDIIKVDVEGAEFDVLRGAEGTLRAQHPLLFLSLHPEPLRAAGGSVEALLEWLAGLGYVARVLARDYELHVLAEPRAGAEGVELPDNGRP